MSAILDWISLDQRQLGWTEVDTADWVGGDLSSVEATLGTLGVSNLEHPPERPPQTLDHRWRVEGGNIYYEARFLGVDREPSRVAFYVVAVLATICAGDRRDLHGLHLALYEILVNVHEHGEPLTDTDPVLRMQLRIDAEGVVGTIEDGCKKFVPEFSGVADLGAKVRHRESRGYGVTLIQRALDSVRHEFGESGNTIHFHKEVTSMTRALKAAPQNFCADREERGGGAVRWVLSGSLDADAAPEISEMFQQALKAGEKMIEIDLEEVGMISSAGVGSLIAGIGEFRDEGGTCRVAALSVAVHHVFAMLDLLDYFECPQMEK